MESSLSAAGMVVTTATTDDDGPGRRLSAGGQPATANGAVRVYARRLLEPYKVAPGLAGWLWRHARDFDLFHIHALFSFTSVAAGLIARRRGVPYVVRPLGTLTGYGLSRRRPVLKRLSLAVLEGYILRHASAVHFTSQAELEEAKALNIPLSGVVIPLGVERAGADGNQDLLRDFPEISGQHAILYLSRLDPKKNIEGLLRAFATLDREQTSAVLLIAGSGERAYLASLKALVHLLRIERYVIWLGHVDGARKAEALARADVFVLPSFSENFGLAAAEALLAGLPCILARGVAIAGAVQEAGAGFAVAPEPEDIAQALARLLGDAQLRSDMRARARQLADREYSVGVMADRLTALYERIAFARKPRAA